MAFRCDRIQSFEVLPVPYMALGKIPWPKPIVAATSRHPKNLFTMVSVLLRRCEWRCLPSNHTVCMFLSRFLLDVSVNSERATASGCVLAKTSSRSPRHSLCHNPRLSRLAQHGSHRLWRFFCSTHHTLQDLQQSQCFDSLRCKTCITHSSISPTCSSARRTRTVQQLDPRTFPDHHDPQQQIRQLSVPGFSGTGRQLAQHRRLLMHHGLDVFDFHCFRCSRDTPTLSCDTVLNVSVAGFVSPCLLQSRRIPKAWPRVHGIWCDTFFWFPLHLTRLIEWRDSTLSANSIVASVHSNFLWHPSDQASPPDASRGLPSVVLVPVSSPAVPADGGECSGCTSPCVPCWIPLSHSRNSFRDGGHDMRLPPLG